MPNERGNHNLNFKEKLFHFFKAVARRLRRCQTDCSIAKSKIQLRKWKNIYAGKRCFIIGNGPSLTAEDLGFLDKELTFASHGIYYIYDKTRWRPTFYTAQDQKLICQRYAEIKDNCKDSQCIFAACKYLSYPRFRCCDVIVDLVIEVFEQSFPKFSANPCRCVYEGMTVTYFNIQLAIYMGFSEIYLLGVDHFYSGGSNDHFSKKDICTNLPKTHLSTKAYIAAKQYADNHGVKIYNATRGGHLEVFERVNFDLLFEKESYES